MASTFTPSGAHAAMACPKCGGEMRAYERSGVIVDACRECRGIFLDRGELEHLVDLEAVASDREDGRPRRGDRGAARYGDDGRDERSRYDDRRDNRAGRYGDDRRESPVEAFGDVGELGGLGEIGELLGSRDRSRPAPDPRDGSAYPPKKRSSFFRDLLEGFGE